MQGWVSELGSLLDADVGSPTQGLAGSGAGNSPRQRILQDRASRAVLRSLSPNQGAMGLMTPVKPLTVLSPPKSLAKGVAAMEERMEDLKNALMAAESRAEAAEAAAARDSEHQLDVAKSQVQVLAIAVASIGASLRDNELERQQLEEQCGEVSQLAELREVELSQQQENVKDSQDAMKQEVEASLREAALRLQASEAAKEGVEEELQVANNRVRELGGKLADAKQALSSLEAQKEEELAQCEVERQNLEATVAAQEGKLQALQDAAEKIACERARDETNVNHDQSQQWENKEKQWIEEKRALEAQVKAQREELDFAKQCLFSKQALRR